MGDSYNSTDPNSKQYWRKFDTQHKDGTPGADGGLDAKETFEKRKSEIVDTFRPDHPQPAGKNYRDKKAEYCELRGAPDAFGGTPLGDVATSNIISRGIAAVALGVPLEEIPTHKAVLTNEAECEAYLQGLELAKKQGLISNDQCAEMSQPHNGSLSSKPVCGPNKGGKGK